MKQVVVKIRNAVLSLVYRYILKPIFFLFEPETTHKSMIIFGELLGRFGITRWLLRISFGYQNEKLSQDVAGLHFDNPIGLAGGFDKNSQVATVMRDIGFGFAEVGSVTARKCAGNPGKHLWRIPRLKSIAVNIGLKNDGVDVIKKRIAELPANLVIGTNIAFTNDDEVTTAPQAIDDYAYSFEQLASLGSYTTLNISCPNRHHDKMFWEPDALDMLLKRVTAIRTKKPLFIKLSPDMTEEILHGVLDVAMRYPVAGFIISNLVKQRTEDLKNAADVPPTGGLSGGVVSGRSDEVIENVYKYVGPRYIVIGCGGVFSAQDAYDKIKKGATLVQLVSGLIYEGPQVVSSINVGLAELLKKDGFKNISEAIGVDVKNSTV